MTAVAKCPLSIRRTDADQARNRPAAKNPTALELLEVSGGVRVDNNGIECSGTEGGLGLCINSFCAAGVVVQAGLQAGPGVVSPTEWCLKDITIEAIWAYPATMWPRIAQLIQTGDFPEEDIVITRTGRKDGVENGLDALVAGKTNATKVLARIGDIE